MPLAKQGDLVKVHYTGRFEDGTVFDSSAGRAPLEFTIGAEQVIPGFERAVIGMNPGETRTETIPAADAYGERDDEMMIVVDRNDIPPDFEPEIGQQLQVRQPDGGVIPVIIVDLSDTTITLDANHPLAGRDLIFEIQLMAIG